jgi:hypothetical protein
MLSCSRSTFFAALAMSILIYSYLHKGFAQSQSAVASENSIELFSGASNGDRAALAEMRRRAANGDAGTKNDLAVLYFEGAGRGKPDYKEAAYWYGCPADADETILAQCSDATFKDLPVDAMKLLNRMKCDSDEGWGSRVVLRGEGGAPQFEICCHDAPHGPCSAVIIGEVSGRWQNLTEKEGVAGYDGACLGLIVLRHQHGGFHDICLPNTCSPLQEAKNHQCVPAVLQFKDGQYQSDVFPLTNPHQ